MTENHLHKLNCVCDNLKHYNSHKRANYVVYVSKNVLFLKCKTCGRKRVIESPKEVLV